MQVATRLCVDVHLHGLAQPALLCNSQRQPQLLQVKVDSV